MIEFTVLGKPMGKPRMTRRDKWAKRPVVLRYWAWADLMRQEAGPLPPSSQVAKVEMTAYFKPAKKTLLSQPHRQRPDTDNIFKAVDSLWKEDSGIHHIEARKLWGEPERLEVKVFVE